jgi:hypothetical protein
MRIPDHVYKDSGGMIWHGMGAGFRERSGADYKMTYSLDFQRPPHSRPRWFKRRVNSVHWRPMAFGNEGSGPLVSSLRDRM